MLFYSDYSYSHSWSVRCATSDHHRDCTENNPNWKEYILIREGAEDSEEQPEKPEGKPDDQLECGKMEKKFCKKTKKACEWVKENKECKAVPTGCAPLEGQPKGFKVKMKSKFKSDCQCLKRCKQARQDAINRGAQYPYTAFTFEAKSGRCVCWSQVKKDKNGTMKIKSKNGLLTGSLED